MISKIWLINLCCCMFELFLISRWTSEWICQLPFTLPLPSKIFGILTGITLQLWVNWEITDIFTKLNPSMQKQGAFLYLCKCWSPPDRDSLENVVVRGFPQDTRPCLTTAAVSMGSTSAIPCGPTKSCKRTTWLSEPKKISPCPLYDNTWLRQGRAPEIPGPSNSQPSKSHGWSTLWTPWQLTPALAHQAGDGQTGSLAWTLKGYQRTHTFWFPLDLATVKLLTFKCCF